MTDGEKDVQDTMQQIRDMVKRNKIFRKLSFTDQVMVNLGLKKLPTEEK